MRSLSQQSWDRFYFCSTPPQLLSTIQYRIYISPDFLKTKFSLNVDEKNIPILLCKSHTNSFVFPCLLYHEPSLQNCVGISKSVEKVIGVSEFIDLTLFCDNIDKIQTAKKIWVNCTCDNSSCTVETDNLIKNWRWQIDPFTQSPLFSNIVRALLLLAGPITKNQTIYFDRFMFTIQNVAIKNTNYDEKERDQRQKKTINVSDCTLNEEENDFITIFQINTSTEIIFHDENHNQFENCTNKEYSGISGQFLNQISEEWELRVNQRIAGFEDIVHKIIQHINDVFVISNTTENYVNIGRGILITGCEGNGKTTIARTIVEESNYKYIFINCVELFQKNVGEAENLLLDILNQPNINIFIFDGIELICGHPNDITGVTELRLRSLLLCKFDEWSRFNKRHICIGICRSSNELAPSMLTCNRFELICHLDIPNFEQRKRIIRLLTTKFDIENNIDESDPIHFLSQRTQGYIIADFHTLCSVAIILHINKRTQQENEVQLNVSQDKMRDNILLTTFISALNQIQPSSLKSYDFFTSLIGKRLNTKFSDVAGLDREIELISTAVLLPLKNPNIFRQFGIPKIGGVLLYGPPGCGKTLLANAVAHEAGFLTNFMSIQCTDIINKYVGHSEQMISKIFSAARKASPCIVLFDQIEVIGSVRGFDNSTSQTFDRILSTLLIELDGMSSTNKNEIVIVLATTNNINLIDPALLRPGRFDHHIKINIPNKLNRKKLLNHFIREIPVDSDSLEDLIDEIVEDTDEWTPADLKQLCQEAAISALREDLSLSSVVKRDHFMELLCITESP